VKYRLQYAFWISKYIYIPKPHDPPTLAFEPVCAFDIVGIFRMLTPISFDNEMIFGTGKIDDVFADGVLTAETVSGEATMTQDGP